MPLQNSVLCGSNNDISMKMSFSWYENSDNVVYGFKLGLDFGYGFAVFLDGQNYVA